MAQCNGATSTDGGKQQDINSRAAEQQGLPEAVSKAEELWKHIAVRAKKEITSGYHSHSLAQKPLAYFQFKTRMCNLVQAWTVLPTCMEQIPCLAFA